MEGIFTAKDHPNLLVGLDGPDDAAVWKIDDDRAIVVTTDFFTPVVDTPYEYGAIAATNSLSDIYAMGGKPFLALNISAFPPDLPAEFLSEILQGGAQKCIQAGVVVAGGHTVQDKEPKFGLVALGFVDPGNMIRKSGAKLGDQLFLTKPIGVGVTTTALKRGLITEAELTEVIASMSTLNDKSGSLAVNHAVKCGTDITGFGLLGHALEMANASDVQFVFKFSAIPLLSGAIKYASDWVFPGGSVDNKIYFENDVTFDPSLSDSEKMLMFDAQTSGGLLLAVPEDQSERFVHSAAVAQQPIWKIGNVINGKGITVIR